MKFITTLWNGRKRRRPNESLQERTAQYTVYPRHRNVQSSTQKPPLRKDKRA